jgi:hypothetical protein
MGFHGVSGEVCRVANVIVIEVVDFLAGCVSEDGQVYWSVGSHLDRSLDCLGYKNMKI